MEVADHSTTLSHLPDELVIQVVSNFHCIRSFETQSEAFKDTEKEKARQCENHARKLTLHALASTSRRMNKIATPILYSSFVGSATWHGLLPLRLFHRTVSTENGKLLARYVTYLENRLSDFLGNGLYDDMEFYGAVEMVAEYFYLLAAIIRQVPNLQHLSVVSLESEDVSLWYYLLPSTGSIGNFFSRPPLHKIADHGLQKLETLSLQIHTEGFGLEPDSAWFRRICSAMTDIPSFRELRASGVITSGSPSPLPGSFKGLRHLEITECVLDFEEVLQLLVACEELKHFGCQWAFLNCGGEDPSDLYAGLLKHKDTLESLVLDTKEVRFSRTLSGLLEPLGSLRDFKSLKSVDICETSLLANRLALLDFPDQKLQYRIAELLPPSLEHLTLRVESSWGYDDDRRIDEAFALWDLTEDCSTLVPNLKEMTVRSSFYLSAPNIEAEFRHYGIAFNSVRERRLPFHD